MFIWVVILGMSRPVGWCAGLEASPCNGRREAVPSWALLSVALSHENRVQAGRPDVDAAVQLAAEITLSRTTEVPVQSRRVNAPFVVWLP